MSSIGSTALVLTKEMVTNHRNQFYEQLNQELATKDHTAYPITEENHGRILAFTLESKAGKSVALLHKTCSQAYTWEKKFTAVDIGTSQMLVYRVETTNEGEVPAGLDQYKQVLHRGNVFDHILAVHTGGDGGGRLCHSKARTFKNAVERKYGASVPSWVTDLLCQTCPVCIRNQKRKKPVAGHTPIITQGFNERGQLDLIDLQSCPDGPFNYILSYHCHGTKAPILEALATKEIRAVAWVLFNIFTMWGPPAFLQTDNGREFNRSACNGRAKKVEIDDVVSTMKLCKTLA